MVVDTLNQQKAPIRPDRIRAASFFTVCYTAIQDLSFFIHAWKSFAKQAPREFFLKSL
jgi:hypothetical protein